ncbi:MAG: TetR family transcriptional regulator [Acidimicrobiales bacterium]|nr:TetR family transcriptional regulator [Acidimicrobiales bacterium]
MSDTGLRERKKAKTRLALEDAALELFATKGFDATTVDEIAAACDVSRRTFFRYYASKEEVFSGEHEDEETAVFEFISARPASEPALTSLRAAVVAMADDLGADRERLLAKMRIIQQTPSLESTALQHSSEMVDRIVEALVARSEGEPAPDDVFRMRLVTQAAIGALRAAIERWAADGGTDDLGEVTTDALDLLAAAFGRTPG